MGYMVPVATADAARSAVAEQASATLLDMAGPRMFAVETADLRRLAAGHVPALATLGYAWLDDTSDMTNRTADC
jgi:hypothetical protein